MQLQLSQITRDRDCQPRAGINLAMVSDYAADMMTGATFPPVTVFRDEERYFLADGFHRLEAAQQLKRDTIEAEVYDGGKRAAMLYAAGANATHGMRRTNEDKRRAVLALLSDEEWSQWSDREIARRCGVSHPFVSQIRASLVTVTSETTERTYTDRHGNVSTMNTANIGSRPARDLDPGPDDVDEQPAPRWQVPGVRAQLEETDEAGADDGDDDYPPATPEQCQAVVSALEAMMTAQHPPDSEVTFRDVVAYIAETFSAETQIDLLQGIVSIAEDAAFARWEAMQQLQALRAANVNEKVVPAVAMREAGHETGEILDTLAITDPEHRRDMETVLANFGPDTTS